MNDKKNCSICVYDSVCGYKLDAKDMYGSRRLDETVTDCCIPEKPLRRLQNHLFRLLKFDVGLYAQRTNEYIRRIKKQSQYWQEVEKSWQRG